MGGDAQQTRLREIESLAVGLAESAQESLDRVREARGELPPQCSLVAFVHIPKTAGGTVVNMLGSACSRPALHDAGNYIVGPEKSSVKLARRDGGWAEWERRGGRVTAGHVPYAVYRRYLPQGTRYMTFLREPVDRVVSHYHQHIRQKRDEPRLARFGQKKTLAASIEEALELGLPAVSNLATRFLCAHPSPIGRLPDRALEDAKANLRNFAFVGLQERFDESIVLLQRMLGLDMTPYVNRHVTLERPRVEDLGDGERELILEHNRLDAELYAFGRSLFEDAVASASEALSADVERLREMSEDMNADALRRARELLDRELPLGASKPKAELFETARRTGVPAAALKHVSKAGVRKHGPEARAAGQKMWTRTGHELAPAGDPLVAFVHIPKTGGASVKSMFARAYSQRTVMDAGNYLRSAERAVATVSGEGIASGRVAVGHIPYGLFRAHLPESTRYVTVLRDPVERVLSHYHGHVRRSARTEEAGVVTADSLQEAIELGLPEMENLATRLLCGEPSPMEELPADALDRAKTNLHEFEFVGITERFDESIVLLQRVLRLPLVPYERQHVSQDRPTVERISEEERRLIVEMNSLDLELYGFACTLFEERVRAAGGDVADQAAELGRRTEIVNERAEAQLHEAAGWLEAELPPGTRRSVASLREAARDAGISDPSVRRAAKLLQVRLERDPSGERRWVRPETTPLA